jgi:hypothetical protein
MSSDYDAGPGQPYGLTGRVKPEHRGEQVEPNLRDERGNPVGHASFAGSDHVVPEVIEPEPEVEPESEAEVAEVAEVATEQVSPEEVPIEGDEVAQ